MSQIIQWCNANQGFLSGCLTFVYVSATLWLVWLARRQLKFAANLERARIRPYVTFDFFFDHYCVFAQVANTGQTAARDIKIEVRPKLEYVFGGEDALPREELSKSIPFVDRGLPMLAPGRRIKALVGFLKRVRSAYPEMRFEGSVWYRSLEGDSYSEPFVIDLKAIIALAYRAAKDIEDVAKELKEISSTLRDVATGYKKPLIRVISEREHIAEEDAALAELIKEVDQTPEQTTNDKA